MTSGRAGEVEKNQQESLDLKELRGQLIAYVTGYVGQRAVAEDLVQDGFLRYELAREGVNSPRAWLYATVRNLALNYLRGRKEMLSLNEEILGDAGSTGEKSPDAALEHLQKVEEIYALIQQLPAREQEILKLKFEEELSYQEISLRMGLSVSNVGYILCQTIRGLQISVKKEGL